MNVDARIRRIEQSVELYFKSKEQKGIVIVFPRGDSYEAMVYHDRRTGEEIPGMYDRIQACTNMDEVREAIGSHGSNLPKVVRI